VPLEWSELAMFTSDPSASRYDLLTSSVGNSMSTLKRSGSSSQASNLPSFGHGLRNTQTAQTLAVGGKFFNDFSRARACTCAEGPRGRVKQPARGLSLWLRAARELQSTDGERIGDSDLRCAIAVAPSSHAVGSYETYRVRVERSQQALKTLYQ
jgi:hypothetical protein